MPDAKKKTARGAAGDDAAAFEAYEKKKKSAGSASKTASKSTSKSTSKSKSASKNSARKTAKSAAAKKTGAKKKGARGRRRKQQTAWWTWPAAVFLMLILVGLSAAAIREKVSYEQFTVMRETVDHEGFYDGISIDGVDVSGRSLNDVLTSLSAHEQSLRDQLSVTLVCGDQSRTITADELDYHSNYEEIVRQAWQVGHEGTMAERYQAIRQMQKTGASYTIERGWDASLLRAVTDAVAAEMSAEAVDAQVTGFDLSTLSFSFSQEQAGAYVDAEQLYQTVYTAIYTGSGNQTIVVSRQTVQPTVTLSELQGRMGMMSEAKTTAGGNKNRKSNIKLALSTLNGVCVQPGEVFSFNGTVGERTAEAGYKSAGAFVDGLLSEELGGGICQVSTTLFNAVAKSDLEVIARSPHSRPVGYVDKGKDAAVSWPNQDFKFMNDTDYPVYIVTRYDDEDNRVYVSLYGLKLENGVYITIEAETLKTYEPGDPVYVYTTELPTGQKKLIEEAREGYYAESYKVYHNADGSEISRELYCRSTYAASGAKYKVGQ